MTVVSRKKAVINCSFIKSAANIKKLRYKRITIRSVSHCGHSLTFSADPKVSVIFATLAVRCENQWLALAAETMIFGSGAIILPPNSRVQSYFNLLRSRMLREMSYQTVSFKAATSLEAA